MMSNRRDDMGNLIVGTVPGGLVTFEVDQYGSYCYLFRPTDMTKSAIRLKNEAVTQAMAEAAELVVVLDDACAEDFQNTLDGLVAMTRDRLHAMPVALSQSQFGDDEPVDLESLFAELGDNDTH
jgi:hypothetical protein